MTERNVPIQSLIDHIKTATDVDPWAKEMAEELLKEQEAVEPVPLSNRRYGGMTHKENVKKALEEAILFVDSRGYGGVAHIMHDALELLKEQEDFGEELTNAMELVHKKNERIKKLEEQIETLTKWRANAGAFD